jgi:hypothetical protein
LLAWRLGSTFAIVAIAIGAFGCNDVVATPIADDGAVPDGFTLAPLPDASPAIDAGSDGQVVTSTFRVAQLAPDLGTVDFCYRFAPSQWIGPVLNVPADGGAPSAAVTFLTVSDWVTVRGSGALEIALVMPGATSCGQPLATGQVTLDAGKRATIVAMGLQSADAGANDALTIAAFIDDPTPVMGKARTRFVHAALGDPKFPDGVGALAVSLVAANVPDVAIAADVERGHASTATTAPPAIDALGYGTIDPLAFAAAVRLDEIASPDAGADAGYLSWQSTDASVTTAAGSIHTGFVASDGAGSVVVVMCDDTEQRATCAILRGM